MLFFEPSFLFLFLPIVLLLDALVPARLRNGLLLAASLCFYAASSLVFLPLLLLSTALDYGLGAWIAAAPSERRRAALLWTSVGANLLLLGAFKYAGLLTGTLASLGLPIPRVSLPLPVGISFYTFQSMSYTIDLYRRDTRPARSFVDFAAFVTLFPQLIAGPIVRFQELEAQLRERRLDVARAANGAGFFVVGLAKKVLLADTAAWLSAPLFALERPGALEAWTAMLLYAAQIYYDFSGYSDMAVGLGRMLGFEFPQNFDSPYQAVSFSDFWRRWHITLSRWLRDNLYIPLGGNRRGEARTYVNLVLTMLLGGLWHGASWTFLAWGAWHGLLLALERRFTPLPATPPTGLARARRIAVVFVAVLLGWVFFRHDTFEAAAGWFGAMALANGVGHLPTAQAVAAGLVTALSMTAPNVWTWRWQLGPGQVVLLTAAFVLAVLVSLGQGSSPFLYYRF